MNQMNSDTPQSARTAVHLGQITFDHWREDFHFVIGASLRSKTQDELWSLTVPYLEDRYDALTVDILVHALEAVQMWASENWKELIEVGMIQRAGDGYTITESLPMATYEMIRGSKPSRYINDFKAVSVQDMATRAQRFIDADKAKPA